MNLEINISEEEPDYLELKVEGEIWRKIPKNLFINKLSELRSSFSLMELKEKLQKFEEEGAYKSILRLLARKSYFSKEVRLKLTQKGFSMVAIDKVIDKCLERGYLNDAEQRERMVRSEMRKGKGPLLIAAKLKHKEGALPFTGIKKEDQQSSIKALIPKLSKKYDLSTREGKGKLFQALQRRGFETESILSCLND